MLVWATEFPVANGKTSNDLLPLLIEWLVKSPHSEWTEAHFEAEVVLGEVTKYEAGGQTVLLAKVDTDHQRWTGLHQSWIENGEREWTTEIVGFEKDDSLWVSVRLDCNLLLPGLRLPSPKKPFIVKLLLQTLGGGYDAILPVSDAPIILQEDEVDLAAGLMIGTTRNQLPVVYVSAERAGHYAVDPEKLAKWLAGMAHVVVEPSRHFSFALARHVSRSNAYGGAVSVYWPNGIGHQARFIPARFDSAETMEREIAATVRTALTHIRPRSEATWGYLREAISRGRIEALKAAGSTEVEEYIRAFDVDTAVKQERLEGAEREIGRLRGEIRRFEAAVGQASEGILTNGREQEFYPGEARDAVLQALRAGRGSLAPNSRWVHLVDDILSVNPKTDFQETASAELKESLSKTKKFGAEQRKTLEALGFDVDESGKHVKAVYHRDDRYIFALGKTNSDHRAGKNMASTIIRKIFG